MGNKEYGTLLRGRREKLGLLQGQVASELGVSQPVYGDLELGKFKYTPAPVITSMLAEILGVSEGEQLQALGYQVEFDSPVASREINDLTLDDLPTILRALGAVDAERAARLVRRLIEQIVEEDQQMTSTTPPTRQQSKSQHRRIKSLCANDLGCMFYLTVLSGVVL